MKIVFLDAKTIGDDIDLSGFDALGEVTRYDFTTPEEAPERVKDADVLIINKVPVNEQTIHTAAHLKLVCVTATGTNNLDKEYLKKRGIAWRNVAGYSTESVTQHTFALLFYLLEKIRYYDDYVKDEKYIKYLEEKQEQLGKLIQELCWNEDRFIRGFTERGEVIGKRTDPEANMWLNPQSWAVISGLATERQADLALQMVYERLNTEYGAILMDPPYHANAFDGALAVIYNAGTKENAGIFSQSQGWLILAEALCGHGERAFNISWRMLRQRRMTGLRSDSWSHTAMDSLQREKQARISDALMYTG